MADPYYWKVYARIDGKRKPLAKFAEKVDAANFAFQRAYQWARFEKSTFKGSVSVQGARVITRYDVSNIRSPAVKVWHNPHYFRAA